MGFQRAAVYIIPEFENNLKFSLTKDNIIETTVIFFLTLKSVYEYLKVNIIDGVCVVH